MERPLTAGPVILIGLDAFDPEIALALAAAGELPILAGLLSAGARAPINNPYGLFVGALWVRFATAQRAARHDYYCWEEVDVQTYQVRTHGLPDEGYDYFWQRLADSVDFHGFGNVSSDSPSSSCTSARRNCFGSLWICSAIVRDSSAVNPLS